MNRIGMNVALIVFVVLSLAGAAIATDSKAYNGSYCKAYYGGETPSFIHQRSGIYNASSVGRAISCPVIEDAIANTSGTNAVNVSWHANAGSDTLFCCLYSMNRDGSLRQSQCGGKTGTGEFPIPKITSDDHDGSYSMICSLPPYGVLNTIWLEEND